jgi:hypothetical protein
MKQKYRPYYSKTVNYSLIISKLYGFITNRAANILLLLLLLVNLAYISIIIEIA